MAKAIDPKQPLALNAARAIGTRLDELFQFDRYTDQPDRVRELHEMRIAAKRLRYTLEIFAPVYEGAKATRASFETALEAVKALQELLGALHDADVLVPQLTAHLAALLEPGHGGAKNAPVVGVHHVNWHDCAGLAALCQTLREQRDVDFARFTTTWRAQNDRQVYDGLRRVVQEAATAVAAEPETPSPALKYENGGQRPGDENSHHDGQAAQANARSREQSGKRNGHTARREPDNAAGDGSRDKPADNLGSVPGSSSADGPNKRRPHAAAARRHSRSGANSHPRPAKGGP